MDRILRIVSCVFVMLAAGMQPAGAQDEKPSGRIDIYHEAAGGYGYLLHDGADVSIWWAEGLYKVMQDTPTPSAKSRQVALKSARGECESFILVLRPKVDITGLDISVSDLRCGSSAVEAGSHVWVRLVEYVDVTTPLNEYTFAGMWPDPLPLFEKGMKLETGRNYAFWITVETPRTAEPGIYKGTVKVSADGFCKKFRLSHKVWSFALPDTPYMRSSMAVGLSDISRFENVPGGRMGEVYDIYMDFMSRYRLTPHNSLQSPIHDRSTGFSWDGTGCYDSECSHSGRYSFRVEDEWDRGVFNARTLRDVRLDGCRRFTFECDYRSTSDCNGTAFEIVLSDAAHRHIDYDGFVCLRDSLAAGGQWSRAELTLPEFPQEAAYLGLKLYPFETGRDLQRTGYAWYDNLHILDSDGHDILEGIGDFEIDLDKVTIEYDFTDFIATAAEQLESHGFNAFNFHPEGIGTGNTGFMLRGIYKCFKQGTPEYEQLIGQYLTQLQDGFEAAGVLGKEVLYWFDEPRAEQYPFVLETDALIHRYAPKLHTLIAEHLYLEDQPAICDVSCLKWNYAPQQKIDKVLAGGGEVWSYICNEPKPPYICQMIDCEAINMRMWQWGNYAKKITGSLLWLTDYWYSEPRSMHHAKPYTPHDGPVKPDFSQVLQYGVPRGDFGDGVLFYPHNTDPNDPFRPTYICEPIPSLRMEILRDGFDDYDYFMMLEETVANAPAGKAALAAEAAELLQIPSEIYRNEYTFTKNPLLLLEYRNRIGEYLDKLY